MRKKIVPAFLLTMACALAVMYFMMQYQPTLLAKQASLFDFGRWIEGTMGGEMFYRFMWFFGDLAEGNLLKSAPAGFGMLLMGIIAYFLERSGSKYAGSGICGNAPVFPEIIIGVVTSIVFSMIVYASFFSIGWIPTFVPEIVVPALVIHFGGGWKKLATIIVYAALVPFLICYFIGTYITGPFGLPGFVGAAFGMAFSIAIGTILFRAFPWMGQKTQPIFPFNTEKSAKREQWPSTESGMFIRTVLSDANQTVFWGSGWATIGLFLGGAISWFMNPNHPVYGMGAYPQMMCMQIMAVTLAVFIYYPNIKRDGGAFTFPGLVMTAAIICTYPICWQIMVPTILIGSILFHPLITWLMKITKYQGKMPACLYVLFSIASVTTLWSFFIMKVMIPVFGL